MQTQTNKILEEMVNQVICGDCFPILKSLPDKCIDLVLTDPPYGIDIDKYSMSKGMGVAKKKDYGKFDWDRNTPPIEIFNELLRVSKKAIIFGGQFFTDKLPVQGHWIVWDKKGDIAFDNPFGDCELAWTNIDRKSVTKYMIIQQGFITSEKQRYHPTQKPINLFETLITDYTELNDLVLDCFLGSGTTAVACKKLNRRFIGIEISPEYCEIARQRLRQGVLNI